MDDPDDCFNQCFTCRECGRLVITRGQLPDPPLCALCITLPGWHENPEIQVRLDPSLDDPNRTD